jgi:DNA (cytosine-5)-methyltransferase 1
LEQAGFDIVFATDNEPKCGESHKLNRPDTPFFLGSIEEVNGRLIREFAGLDDDDTVDLLVGGPPCPPFSKSRFYRKDKPRAMGDATAEITVGGYFRVLEDLRPSVFLLENVHGMAYKAHQDSLDWILNRAKELGYTTNWLVLNAADFGVPQLRERFILVGARDGSVTFPLPTHAKPAKIASGEASTDRLPWVTAGEVLSDLDTEENASDEGHFAGGKHHHLLREIPPGDNYLFYTAKRGHPTPLFEWRSRYWSFLLKLSPEMPSWTIQARRSNNMGPLHWRNRILRIEEIKRLQTFPDEWQLAGTIEQQWRQVGNAVPPLMAEHLGHAIRRHLMERSASGAPARSQRVLAGSS